MNHSEFLRQRLGDNWVLVHAVRKKPKYDRSGNLQTQVSRKRYDEVEREWRATHGDPYDQVRADLYTSLRDMVDSFGHLSPQLKAQAEDALKAELARP